MCCSRMKSTADGNPKANKRKIYMAGWERHCCTHTHINAHAHMHAHRSPEDYHQRSTGHFREDSICSLPYLIQQKRTLCSQKTLFSLWEDTDPNTVVWTHIILSKLHISTVQLTAESSQVARCIYTVTKKQFAQELFTDTRVLPFKAMLWLSFPPHYAGVLSGVLSPALSLSVSIKEI